MCPRQSIASILSTIVGSYCPSGTKSLGVRGDRYVCRASSAGGFAIFPRAMSDSCKARFIHLTLARSMSYPSGWNLRTKDGGTRPRCLIGWKKRRERCVCLKYPLNRSALIASGPHYRIAGIMIFQSIISGVNGWCMALKCRFSVATKFIYYSGVVFF